MIKTALSSIMSIREPWCMRNRYLKEDIGYLKVPFGGYTTANSSAPDLPEEHIKHGDVEFSFLIGQKVVVITFLGELE